MNQLSLSYLNNIEYNLNKHIDYVNRAFNVTIENEIILIENQELLVEVINNIRTLLLMHIAFFFIITAILCYTLNYLDNITKKMEEEEEGVKNGDYVELKGPDC